MLPPLCPDRDDSEILKNMNNSISILLHLSFDIYFFEEQKFFFTYIDGLVQDCCNSSVLAMELRLICTCIYVELCMYFDMKANPYAWNYWIEIMLSPQIIIPNLNQNDPKVGWISYFRVFGKLFFIHLPWVGLKWSTDGTYTFHPNTPTPIWPLYPQNPNDIMGLFIICTNINDIMVMGHTELPS